MKINSNLFHPRPGKLSAHLFENPTVGVDRDLFWSIAFDFEAFEFEGEKEIPNCMAEWLLIPHPDSALGKPLTISSLSQPDGEASCYIQNQHIPADEWRFDLRPQNGGRAWSLEYELKLDTSFLGENGQPELKIAGTTSLEFGSFIIVKENLFPKIDSAQEATEALSRYIDNVESLKCCDEGFRYAFYKQRN